MLFRRIKGLLALLALVSCCWASAAGRNPSAKKPETDNQVAKVLPEKIGDFKAAPPAARQEPLAAILGDEINGVENRSYVKGRDHVGVSLFTAASDAAAYAALTRVRQEFGQTAQPVAVGTVGFETASSGRKIYFYKGQAVAIVSSESPGADASTATLAEALAETLDKGSGEIPVLVKHLPDWQNKQPTTIYAVSQPTLAKALKGQPIIDALNFTGGAEAAVANYNSERLAIIEFNTASLASDNDQRIKAKLQELREQQQPTPTAYRRIGNYAVFVFDAPNEQAANQLIDQVKYEQVVQWLGQNPFSYEQATREFAETTLGVFVSVVKASGMALLTTFIVGGFFGTILFRVRRAQQRAREAYSDSDTMIRLNLDEMTPESTKEFQIPRKKFQIPNSK